MSATINCWVFVRSILRSWHENLWNWPLQFYVFVWGHNMFWVDKKIAGQLIFIFSISASEVEIGNENRLANDFRICAWKLELARDFVTIWGSDWMSDISAFTIEFISKSRIWEVQYLSIFQSFWTQHLSFILQQYLCDFESKHQQMYFLDSSSSITNLSQLINNLLRRLLIDSWPRLLIETSIRCWLSFVNEVQCVLSFAAIHSWMKTSGDEVVQLLNEVQWIAGYCCELHYFPGDYCNSWQMHYYIASSFILQMSDQYSPVKVGRSRRSCELLVGPIIRIIQFLPYKCGPNDDWPIASWTSCSYSIAAK